MIFLSELTQHADEGLKEFLLSKKQDQYISSTEEMLAVTQNQNSTLLSRTCNLRVGQDYIIVRIDAYPKTLRAMIELGLSKGSHSNKGTLYFESAIWKLLLHSKKSEGAALKDALVKNLIPNSVERKSGLELKSIINSINY